MQAEPSTSFPPKFFASLGLVVEGDPSSWAVFSECRKYRYVLARMWDNYFLEQSSLFGDAVRPLLIVGMCNPSKAGAYETDPTATKVRGFAERLGCGGYIAVNCGAFIATDPSDFAKATDPIGPHNVAVLRWAFRTFYTIRVAAWGRMPSKRLRERVKVSMLTMQQVGAKWCWGKTKDGEPRHPLMLAYDTPLVRISDGAPYP
jgi:hypothetical protein